MSVISTVKPWSPSSSSSSMILKSIQLVVGPPTENMNEVEPSGLKSAPAKQEKEIKQFNIFKNVWIFYPCLLALPTIEEIVIVSSVCTDPMVPESTQILTEPSSSLTDCEFLIIITTASSKKNK